MQWIDQVFFQSAEDLFSPSLSLFSYKYSAIPKYACFLILWIIMTELKSELKKYPNNFIVINV